MKVRFGGTAWSGFRRYRFRKRSHATYRKTSAVSGPACWLWDYLRRSGSAAGYFLPLSVVSTINYDWCGNESNVLERKHRKQGRKEGRWRHIRSPLEFLVPVLIRSFLCSFHHAVLVPVLLIHLLFSRCQRLYTQAAPTHRRLEESSSCDVLTCERSRSDGRKESRRICHGFVCGKDDSDTEKPFGFPSSPHVVANHVQMTHGRCLDRGFIATNQITGPVALWIRLVHTTFFFSEYQDGHDGSSRCRYFWFVVGCRSLNKAQEARIARHSITGLVMSVSILHSLGRDGTSLLPVSK